MPFTPFHLAAGALFKSIGGSRFSFMVFGGSQVLMDIEPLVGIIQGNQVLHGPSHTVLGALVIGLASGTIGRPISEMVLRLLRIKHRPLTWMASFCGAFVGTFSHVGLDAIMHRDMHPLWPFALSNGMLGVISVAWLHVLCLIAGLLGVLLMVGRQHFASSRIVKCVQPDRSDPPPTRG
jgi:hypothetical protein